MDFVCRLYGMSKVNRQVDYTFHNDIKYKKRLN